MTTGTAPDARSRLATLRELLEEGSLSTQDELREKLEKRGFSVTQSTISRDLRKVGAVRGTDPDGQTVYRMGAPEAAPVTIAQSLRDLVTDIESNGAIIVVHTTIGSASLVARHLDLRRPGKILGTIAGDDTIFVAPPSMKGIASTIRAIEESFSEA